MSDVILSPIPYNGGTINTSYHDICWVDRTNDKFVYTFYQTGTNANFTIFGVAQLNGLGTSTPSVNYLQQRAFMGDMRGRLYRLTDDRFVFIRNISSDDVEIKVFRITPTNDIEEIGKPIIIPYQYANYWPYELINIIPNGSNEFYMITYDNSRIYFYKLTYTDYSSLTQTFVYNYPINLQQEDNIVTFLDENGNYYFLVMDISYTNNNKIRVVLYTPDFSSFHVISSYNIYGFFPIRQNLRLRIFSSNHDYFQKNTNETSNYWSTIYKAWSSGINVVNNGIVQLNQNTIMTLNLTSYITSGYVVSYNEANDVVIVSMKHILNGEAFLFENNSISSIMVRNNFGNGQFMTKYGTDKLISIRRYNDSANMWKISVFQIDQES